MAITRAEKEKSIERLTNDLAGVKIAVLTDYRGLNTTELEELREVLRKNFVEYRITKNTLLKLALKNNPQFKNIDLNTFTGPLAIAFGKTDEIMAAKLIQDYAKTHEALEIIGGITNQGVLLNAAETKALAALPTKDQLKGQLVGVLVAPIVGLVNIVNANLRSLINALNAVAQATTVN